MFGKKSIALVLLICGDAMGAVFVTYAWSHVYEIPVYPHFPSLEAIQSNVCPEQGTTTIAGVVNFEGPIPAKRMIDISGASACAKATGANEIENEKFLISDDHKLANVVVYVKRFPAQWIFPERHATSIIEMKNCRYSPHVLAIQMGDSVTFENRDDSAHNPHCISCSDGCATQQAASTYHFDEPEVFAEIRCNIHGWMSAHIAVFDHPFYAVTSRDGTFTFPRKLPPGEYLITAAHERFGERTCVVTVSDADTLKHLRFTFSADNNPNPSTLSH